jgi:IS5 family transposase
MHALDGPARGDLIWCGRDQGISAVDARADVLAAAVSDGVAAGGTRGRCIKKVTSTTGRAIYARRKVMVEPVFGQIKQAMGFRRFSLRGLAKAAAEWAIVCLCHNLLKLHRALWASATAS